MTLKFTKIGWFLEEDSARYQAKINENLFVNIYKCSYSKDWFCRLITKEGYSLDYQTSDLNSSINSYSKKSAIAWLEKQFDNKDYINKLTEQSIKLDKILK